MFSFQPFPSSLHSSSFSSSFVSSGSIIYLMVAVGNWVSVSIVSIFGAKWSLVISGALYV